MVCSQKNVFRVLCAVLAIAGSRESNAAASEKNQRFEVQGHRGARAARPENTLPAFQYALEIGVDTLELDLSVTKDGELLISHDPLVSPEICTGMNGKELGKPLIIREITLAEAQGYDCGKLKNPRFPDQVPVPNTPKPSLRQLFAMVRDSKLPAAAKIHFNIETKIYPTHPELTPSPRDFAQAIIELAREFQFLDRIQLQSFDDRTLLAAKKIEPRLRTILLTSDNHIDFVAAARKAGAGVLSPDHEWILPEDIVALHKAGIRVVPWTANEPKAWQRLLDMGVDGIISDSPKELIEFLHSKGKKRLRFD